jgi:hypothetical protein
MITGSGSLTPASKAPAAPLPPLPKDQAPEPKAPAPAVPKAEVPEAPKAATPQAPAPVAPKTEVPEAPKAPAPKEKKKSSDDPFGQNDSGKLRQWTDSSGQFGVEARLVSLQHGTVRLQKANGRYVRVALARLSVGDQRFVLEQDQALAAE